MKNKELLKICRSMCTRQLGWNDKKRKECIEKQACLRIRLARQDKGYN